MMCLVIRTAPALGTSTALQMPEFCVSSCDFCYHCIQRQRSIEQMQKCIWHGMVCNCTQMTFGKLLQHLVKCFLLSKTHFLLSPRSVDFSLFSIRFPLLHFPHCFAVSRCSFYAFLHHKTHISRFM